MQATASPQPARQALRSKPEAAEYLGGISIRTLERLVKDGQLRPVKLRGRVMFSQTALDAVAENGAI